MTDLLVNLYSHRLDALGARVADTPAVIRRALPPETHVITDWVEAQFSRHWSSEVSVAMAHQPPGCLIATIDDQLVGFACFDATAKGFFGPTGVDETCRGKGVGLALFYHSLKALKDLGYAYAFIGKAGPIDFYRNAVGAMPIETRVSASSESRVTSASASPWAIVRTSSHPEAKSGAIQAS